MITQGRISVGLIFRQLDERLPGKIAVVHQPRLKRTYAAGELIATRLVLNTTLPASYAWPYTYTGRRLDDEYAVAGNPLGLLGVKCVGEGMQFFTRQFGTSAGLAQFWWGIALYTGEKGEPPEKSGTVIMRRKLNLDYTTCGRKVRYRHDEEGWFLHPFSPNDIGKKPHHVGLAGMEDGTVALAVMDISFGPGASFFTGARPGPRGVATREDAMCSRGRLDVVVDFRVYAADISREGFGPNRKFEPAGMDSFRDVWSEYNRKGYATDVEPIAWRQEPMSHKSVNVAIRWDCCSNAMCTFEAAGDAVPGGPQRLGHTAAEGARLCRSPEHRGNWQCE